MAENIPFVVRDPLQMLWQFQQDQARTNLLNNQSQLVGSEAQAQAIKNLLTGQQIRSNAAIQDEWQKMSAQDQPAAQVAPQSFSQPMSAPQMGGPGGDDSSGPAPQQTAPMPAVARTLTPIQQAEQRLMSMEKTAANYDRLARTPNILTSDIEKLTKAAQDVRAKIQDDQIKLMKEKGDQLTRIGGYAGSAAQARTPDALATALQGIANEDPRILRQLPVDIQPDGTVAPTDRTFNALQNLANATMKQSEQLSAQHQAKTLQQTKARDDEIARANVMRELNNDIRTGIYREGVAAATKNAATNAAREERAASAPTETLVGTLDDNTARFAAETFLKTGLLPNLGYGRAGAANRQQVLAMAAEIAKDQGLSGTDVAAARGSFKADSASLTQATKSLDAVTSFSNTAIKNGDVLVKMAKEVDATGVPLIERWIRAGRQATGDPKVAAFNAQMRVYIPEVAKILSNPNLTGQLTDTARKEIESVVSGGASAEQILAIHNTLKTDFANRENSIKEQISEIKKRMGEKKGGAQEGAKATVGAPTQIKNADEYNALPKGAVFIDPNGVQRTKQ